MRRASARDHNEKDIVKALEGCGKMVDRLSGKDIPDLLVITPGPSVPVFFCESVDEALLIANKNYPIALIEIKQPKTGRISSGQQEWNDAARAKAK